MNKIFEDAAAKVYPTFRNDQKEHIHMLRRKSFVEGCQFANPCGFVDWMVLNAVMQISGTNLFHYKNAEQLTTEQLYEIFKTQK